MPAGPLECTASASSFMASYTSGEHTISAPDPAEGTLVGAPVTPTVVPVDVASVVFPPAARFTKNVLVAAAAAASTSAGPRPVSPARERHVGPSLAYTAMASLVAGTGAWSWA